MRSRAPVQQARVAFGAVPPDPLVGRRTADPELLGDMCRWPAGLDTADQELPAEDAQPRSRMSHARALTFGGVRHPNRSTRALVLSTRSVGTTARAAGRTSRPALTPSVSVA